MEDSWAYLGMLNGFLLGFILGMIFTYPWGLRKIKEREKRVKRAANRVLEKFEEYRRFRGK